MSNQHKNISNPVFPVSLDQIGIKLVTSAVTDVKPFREDQWRILPFSVLTSVDESIGENPGASQLDFADGSVEYFAPGTTVLLPRNMPHRFTHLRRPHTAVWLHWDVTLAPGVDLFRFYDFPRVIRGGKSRKILELTREIVVCPEQTITDAVRKKTLLYKLLESLLADFQLKTYYRDYYVQYCKFANLLNFIEQNLHGHITLEDAARFQQCSVSKLQKDFAGAFGLSIGQFILQQRLKKVANTLVTGNLTLEEIAAQTGFANAFALSKSFKKHFHLSPKEYRKL